MNKLEVTLDPTILEAFRCIVREELSASVEALRKKPKSYTRKEAAQNILKCSLPTLDKHIDEGRISVVKQGRRIFIPESSIEKFLSGNQ